MKRIRNPKAKPGELLMFWGKLPHDSPDVCYAWGADGADKCDGALLNHVLTGKRLRIVYGEERERLGSLYAFDESLLDELKKRGYDITTLRFYIRQLPKQTATEPTVNPSHGED